MAIKKIALTSLILAIFALACGAVFNKPMSLDYHVKMEINNTK